MRRKVNEIVSTRIIRIDAIRTAAKILTNSEAFSNEEIDIRLILMVHKISLKNTRNYFF